jgi:glutathione synthase/RimK-type ligase-like ATP-grasp enzyme
MAKNGDAPNLTILYEHPDWFRPLFAALERRGIGFRRTHVDGHHFDPAAVSQPRGVVFNRMSPSAWQRGRGSSIAYTTALLAHLEERGVRVLNGLSAWRTEVSKAGQLALLERLGLPCPRARVIHGGGGAAEAAVAARLRFPVVTKPNVGGSGAGVRRYDTPEELAESARLGAIDLGLDGTGLVQEFIPARDGHIVRVEVLNGSYLYAIAVYAPPDTFDLCPADICLGTDGSELTRSACPVDAPRSGVRVEAAEPPIARRRQVEAIARSAGIEIGGVEYIVDDRDGRLYFYDINALSNFVADAPKVVGFDPFERLVDWLERELAAVATRRPVPAGAPGSSRGLGSAPVSGGVA